MAKFKNRYDQLYFENILRNSLDSYRKGAIKIAERASNYRKANFFGAAHRSSYSTEELDELGKLALREFITKVRREGTKEQILELEIYLVSQEGKDGPA